MTYDIKTIAVDSIKIRYTVPKDRITSIFFLGLGQRGHNLQWVADSAPKGMIIVEGVNYLKKENSYGMKQLGIATAKYFLDRYHRYGLEVYAESQSVPAVLQACLDIQPKKIGLLSPLGLNASNLNDMSFISRCLKVWLHPHQNIFNKANRHTLKHIVVDVVQHPVRTIRAYGYASKSDVLKELHWLAENGTTVSIMIGENDQIFPVRELKTHVSNTRSIKLKTWKHVGHVNRATRTGMKQLQEIHQMVSAE